MNLLFAHNVSEANPVFQWIVFYSADPDAHLLFVVSQISFVVAFPRDLSEQTVT